MGLRYGLLAALTLVLASALLWDRLHPPRTTALFPRDLPAEDETVRVVVGGREPPPAPEPPPALPPDPGDLRMAGEGADEIVREDGERTYTIAPGDTLGGIALATLGTSKRAAELASHNGMTVKDPLRVGAVLRIPPLAPASPPVQPSPRVASRPAPPPPAPREKPPDADRSHRVGKGDTLYGLSRRYYGNGGRWSAIAEANGLSEGDPLVPGTTLRIP